METKYDAIEYFKFMQRIYNKVNKAGFVNDGGEVNLCGVFFYKEHSYSTNGHIIGRVGVSDNMCVENPMFWRYSDEDIDNIASKFLLNFKNYCKPNNEFDSIFNEKFADNLTIFFNRHMDNCFFFKRDYLFNLLNEIYGDKEATKIKTYVNIRLLPNYDILLDFRPINPTPKNQPVQRTIPIFSSPSLIKNINTTDFACCINVFYFYNILKYCFKKESIVGIKFKSDLRVPVVLFNKRDDIHWAIAQKV